MNSSVPGRLTHRSIEMLRKGSSGEVGLSQLGWTHVRLESVH